MMALLLWQAYSCYFLLEAYGALAFFLSPVRTWALMLSLLLVYRAWKGPVPHLRNDSKASLASWPSAKANAIETSRPSTLYSNAFCLDFLCSVGLPWWWLLFIFVVVPSFQTFGCQFFFSLAPIDILLLLQHHTYISIYLTVWKRRTISTETENWQKPSAKEQWLTTDFFFFVL